MSSNRVTVIAMLLTVAVSVGSSFVASLVQSGKQEVKLSTLENTQREAKIERDNISREVNQIKVDNAKTSEAVSNLVVTTKDLATSVDKLVVVVAKLEK